MGILDDDERPAADVQHRRLERQPTLPAHQTLGGTVIVSEDAEDVIV